MGHAMRWLNAKPNKFAIAGLAVQPDDHILELGFGPGEALASMARLAPSGKIYGIDASTAMLAQAMRRNRHSVVNGQISLQRGECYPLAFADGSLNKILAVNVVYFWQNAPAILAECRRVLRPGGKICIYATDAGSMRHWKFAGGDTHILYTAADLRAALLKGGFTNDDIAIDQLSLPAGIKGLLAVARKSAIRSLSTNH